METLTAVSRWLAKQHVVTWCVHHEGELWCANAFYLFDAQKMAFYVLTEDKTRHAQMSGPRAPIAGTVNGQPKTVALIRGVQFKGRFAVLKGWRVKPRVTPTTAVSLSPECCQRPCGRFDWMKSNSRTTRWASVKRCTGYVIYS